MHGCPACASSRLEVVLDWPDVPANSALFLDTREEAIQHPHGALRLTVCGDCGFVFNADFDPALPEYSDRNLETQLWSPGFHRFATTLAGDWISEYGLQNEEVLEIGAGGRGEFLHLFCELSGGAGVGLDPAVSQEENGRVRLLSRRFDDTWLEPARAVICRHTLEHIGAVGAFLDQLARWGRTSPEAVYLFELPNFSTILDRRSFWDIYYEHASYFTGETLSATFARHGFEAIRCRQAFDDQYLILEARLAADDPPTPVVDVRSIVGQVRQLAADYKRSAPLYARRFAELRADGPVVIWQAGAKAIAFLGMPDLAGHVDALVDINPDKPGRFVVGSGLPVVAPDALSEIQPAHIVVMNQAYLGEITTRSRELGVDATVQSADTLILRSSREPHARSA